MNTLGKYLAAARANMGLTLRAAEEKSGGAISNGYISQLENGVDIEVTPAKLKILADIYALPYELLMQLAGYLDSPKTQTAKNTKKRKTKK